jgi:hypothetical protein
VVNEEFGYDELEQHTDIDELLETAAQIDSLSAQILLREAYETSYAIANHRSTSTHPWSLVLAREKENYNHYGTLYNAIHLFRLADVAKRFGYNLTEYLELPREIIEVIQHICQQEDRANDSTFDELKKRFDDDVEALSTVTKKR